MRKTSRCPKCDHDRVLHITQVADRADNVRTTPDDPLSPIDTGSVHPWRLARIWNPDRGLFDFQLAAAGLVEAYVCRRCGFTELYTQGVDAIEPDGQLIRELRAPEGEGPFR